MVANHFEKIAQELLKQKQLMDKLEAANRELRTQIADLRSGRGIFVDLNGNRFALKDDPSLAQTTSAPSVPASASPSTSTTTSSTQPATLPLDQHIVDAPTEMIPEVTAQRQEQSTKEQTLSANNDKDKNALSGKSTFLEEILIDEFANALTTPSAAQQDPTKKKPSNPQRKAQEPINERQKETLRRELTGSYLLE